MPQQHYAFRVGTAQFDAILARILAEGLAFCSLPQGTDDHPVNPAIGGRIGYWREPDGHVWEMLTVGYERQTPAAGR